MDRFLEILKRHPLWIVGAVLAVVVVLWFSSRGGGGSPTIVSVGPSDATVQANAAIEGMRIQTQAQGAANQAAIEMAKINADSYTQFLSTSKDVSFNQSASQEHLASIITGATTSQTQIAANAATDLATINKNREESLANIKASLEKEKISGQIASNQAASDASVKVAQINAQSVLDQYAQKVQASQQWWPYPDVLKYMLGTPGNSPSNVTTVSGNSFDSLFGHNAWGGNGN